MHHDVLRVDAAKVGEEKERRGKGMKDEDLNRTERREIGRCKN
jgi:hypothetical protein